MDNDQKRDYHHVRNLNAAPPESSEGEDSPITWPISKTNDSTNMTYNYNLDNDRHFKRETTVTLESWARRL